MCASAASSLRPRRPPWPRHNPSRPRTRMLPRLTGYTLKIIVRLYCVCVCARVRCALCMFVIIACVMTLCLESRHAFFTSSAYTHMHTSYPKAYPGMGFPGMRPPMPMPGMPYPPFMPGMLVLPLPPRPPPLLSSSSSSSSSYSCTPPFNRKYSRKKRLFIFLLLAFFLSAVFSFHSFIDRSFWRCVETIVSDESRLGNEGDGGDGGWGKRSLLLCHFHSLLSLVSVCSSVSSVTRKRERDHE